MRDVFVAGIGITTFGRLEYPLSEIASYPAMMAMRDAGIDDVEQVYVANMGSGRINHQTGLASAVVDSLSLTPAGAETIKRDAKGGCLPELIEERSQGELRGICAGTAASTSV